MPSVPSDDTTPAVPQPPISWQPSLSPQTKPKYFNYIEERTSNDATFAAAPGGDFQGGRLFPPWRSTLPCWECRSPSITRLLRQLTLPHQVQEIKHPSNLRRKHEVEFLKLNASKIYMIVLRRTSYKFHATPRQVLNLNVGTLLTHMSVSGCQDCSPLATTDLATKPASQAWHSDTQCRSTLSGNCKPLNVQ